ncbi:hypothetical protein [Ruminococcus albus]|uniref:Uncharacterized protein n=1 Tax=Ruminococcus albus TaxID=1264 RepID=A0A1I1R5K0_RUMAL|nr:hypothetical protein [Ruminococcus albus]SFD29575.1 hypothetical protein SAMN02910406_03602 [Ruminococcus albus]
MKARRFIAGLSALTIAGVMTMTAFAEENTVTNEDTLPAENSTTVNYLAAPKFTVTIPRSVTLDTADVTDSIKVEGETEGSTPFLQSGSTVTVKLADARNGISGKKLTVKANDVASANYTLVGKNGAAGKDDVVAEFDYDPTKTAADYTQDITFTAPTGYKYAGTYTDKLTFTISVSNMEDFAIYDKNSEGIADGIILKPGQKIITKGTSRTLRFDIDTTVDYYNDGSEVYINGYQESGIERFYINSKGEFICVNNGVHSKFIPNEGKQFKISYNANDNKWDIEQV